MRIGEGGRGEEDYESDEAEMEKGSSQQHCCEQRGLRVGESNTEDLEWGKTPKR